LLGGFARFAVGVESLLFGAVHENRNHIYTSKQTCTEVITVSVLGGEVFMEILPLTFSGNVNGQAHLSIVLPKLSVRTLMVHRCEKFSTGLLVRVEDLAFWTLVSNRDYLPASKESGTSVVAGGALWIAKSFKDFFALTLRVNFNGGTSIVVRLP